jgi:hypothetical protein
MTVARSNQGPCLGLKLLDTRGGVLTEPCGVGDFNAATVGGGDELRDTTVVFGPVPEQSTAVRVTAAAGFSSTTGTLDAPGLMRGKFYVLEIPRTGLRDVRVNWLDGGGKANGPGVYLPSTLSHTAPPLGSDPPR